jgi:hypothetical protein
MPFLGSPTADNARICLLVRQLTCLSEKSYHSRQAWHLKTRLLLSGLAKPHRTACPTNGPILHCTNLSRRPELHCRTICDTLDPLTALAMERRDPMVQTLCPKCSCDAASVLSVATKDGCFTASVQCHVCGFEKTTDQGFQDEWTAREVATQSWVDGTEPIAPSQQG